MLILVRHGESVGNALGLLLGRADAELTPLGIRQAIAARRLVHDPVAEVRSSPLQRARYTAELLGLGLPVTVDPRWVEVDYGEFDGRPLGEVPAEVWRRWRDDRGFRPEGGESLAEAETRVVDACAELFAAADAGARRQDGDVVVVSHVTPIKTAVAWALGADDLSWRLHLRTGSVTRIGWGSGGPVLHGFNEVSAVAATDQAAGARIDRGGEASDLAPVPRQTPQSPGA